MVLFRPLTALTNYHKMPSPVFTSSSMTGNQQQQRGGCLLQLLLLQCGDIEANPGPPRRRPDAAAKGPTTEEKVDALSRDNCDIATWDIFTFKCAKMNLKIQNALILGFQWQCCKMLHLAHWKNTRRKLAAWAAIWMAKRKLTMNSWKVRILFIF